MDRPGRRASPSGAFRPIAHPPNNRTGQNVSCCNDDQYGERGVVWLDRSARKRCDPRLHCVLTMGQFHNMSDRVLPAVERRFLRLLWGRPPAWTCNSRSLLVPKSSVWSICALIDQPLKQEQKWTIANHSPLAVPCAERPADFPSVRSIGHDVLRQVWPGIGHNVQRAGRHPHMRHQWPDDAEGQFGRWPDRYKTPQLPPNAEQSCASIKLGFHVMDTTECLQHRTAARSFRCSTESHMPRSLSRC